jgi:hypothetical protein
MRQGGASGPRNIGDSQLTAKSVAFENAVYHSDLASLWIICGSMDALLTLFLKPRSRDSLAEATDLRQCVATAFTTTYNFS